MIQAFVCGTCGVQHAPSERPAAKCVVCEDDRQYVLPSGQVWTTLASLQARNYNAWREIEPNLLSVVTFPHFAIGQRAFLICTPQGNILWDCIALIDPATVRLIEGLGGLKGIAISHPHYYSTMVEWSRAFGGVPVHVHDADSKWIMRDDPCLDRWRGKVKELLPGVTLICAGGHFPGGTVLHWAGGSAGKGTLLPGDVVQVSKDNKSVSFMWSYPNLVPLSGPSIEAIVQGLNPYPFDRIHGAFVDCSIPANGSEVVVRCAQRYLNIIRGDGSFEKQ
jgi:hypothetical protein